MENLKVKTCDFESKLSFNDWVKEFNVSSQHELRTNYYQGNPSSGIKPIGVAKYLDETPFERFVRVLFNKIHKL
jgi:hypothetical protein